MNQVLLFVLFFFFLRWAFFTAFFFVSVFGGSVQKRVIIQMC